MRVNTVGLVPGPARINPHENKASTSSHVIYHCDAYKSLSFISGDKVLGS